MENKNKPIDMLATFDKDGNIVPIRFRVKKDEDTYTTIVVDRINCRSEEKLEGSRTLIFYCQSEINNSIKLYELKYELCTCRWILFKI